MPLNIASLKADPRKQEEGVWLKFVDDDEDDDVADKDAVWFLIADQDRRAYFKALGKLKKTERYQDRKTEKDPSLNMFMAIEAQADAVLLDWKNVEGEDGKPLPVTRENKILLLSSSKIRNFVNTQANKLSNFQAEATAGDAAKLKSSRGVDPQVGK